MRIHGTRANDNLVGTEGGDVFVPMHGNDIMTGNGGNDVFFFRGRDGVSGNDYQISDYSPATDESPGDVIRIAPELMQHGYTTEQIDADTVRIRLEHDDITIDVTGVAPITADDLTII